MNKQLAKLIDHIGLSLLHRQKSKKSHFFVDFSEIPIPDQNALKDFYLVPDLPNIKLKELHAEPSYKIWKYYYDSQLSTEDDRTNINTGLFYENQSNNNPRHIIFVHGWRMDDFKKIENIFLATFKRLGYNMYFLTLPYHHERASTHSLYNGELMISANINRTLLAVKQAVTDIRAMIHWIKKNQSGQVALIGISLGGFITNLTSVVEEQIDTLISIMYTNSLACSVWNTAPGKYIRQDLEQNGFTYEQLKHYWAITDASLFQPRISREKILLLSGKYDQYVSSEDTDRLWKAWGKPKRIIYTFGHAGLIFNKKQIRDDVIDFIKNC
ncbi:alpha/beta hydrolase [Phosphitispora sp. TUW77]|uniref:alpha/beta hydrolase n=1 Tax=Phosphitispora sp. TUW77 TaxID=3152361 RepID=UPI003AB78F3B